MLFTRKKWQNSESGVGLDLGTSQVKGVAVHRRDRQFGLTAYALHPLSTGVGKRGMESAYAEYLHQVMGELNVTDRRAHVTISCSSAMVCQTEVPRMPLSEVKSALKLNSSRYLRRDFSNFYLDAVEILEPTDGGKGKKPPKMKILVAGADKEEVAWYRDALLAAKIRPEVLELAAVSVINALQASQPEVCEEEAVLLIDMGARSTSINFLCHGQPIMTRIMHFGGHQLSEYVAQMLTLEERVAEEEKIRMSEPVQALVRSAIQPLAREIRSSIDFFERQQECHLGRAFACGGSACSPPILEDLGEAVGIRLEAWNPIGTFRTEHFNGDGERLKTLAPSLAAAVGAATARLV